jgi:hypothetical protein
MNLDVRVDTLETFDAEALMNLLVQAGLDHSNGGADIDVIKRTINRCHGHEM